MIRYQFMRFPGGKDKAVTLSYDDGIPADMKLSDTLEKYGMKCTFNLNNDSIRPGRCLTEDQVRKYILDRGHEIAVHGDLHRAMGTLRPIEGIRDVLDCRLYLEEKYGIIIRGMAYPDSGICYFTNGTDYAKIKSYLQELDICYSRTLAGDNNCFNLPNDWHAWMPNAHHDNPLIFEYIDDFINTDLKWVYDPGRDARLFYLWGHSYEFDDNNNWDHLEAICEKLSGKEDTWYATNMEIYDYVTAYRSLVYSADGRLIYNPTLHTIWIDVDFEQYMIKPGETLKLEK